MEDYKESFAYEKAKKKMKEIRGFYINLALYCTVIPILIFINLTFTPDFYWFFFSMGGWGLGLLFHAMEAFNFIPFLNKDWEERKMRQFMEEDRKAREKFANYDNQTQQNNGRSI